MVSHKRKFEELEKFNLLKDVNDKNYFYFCCKNNIYENIKKKRKIIRRRYSIMEQCANKIKKNFKIFKMMNYVKDIASKNKKSENYYINKTNFIGNKIVEGQKISIQEKNIKNLNLYNKIVLIEKADPGYDFIFSHKISGLITKFGGVNSHMAIRCSELSIQAAIGVGEKNFLKFTNANRIQINGKNQTLNKII